MDFVGYRLRNNLFVAPMAGVTDRPFRQLCKKLGAGLAVSAMVTSNSLLYGSAKTQRRANHDGEVAPISVQIAGADPAMMAEAAKYNADRGAQIIDINMGCPAKKVCNVMAGSALLQHETLVGQILSAVVNAVPDTPVTLKIRTGWNVDNKNAPSILRIAEESGIRALAVHGRTRCQQYRGEAEFDTISAVKAAARIPVIANGEITTPEKAKAVLEKTGADGVMIGRGCYGRPWFPNQVGAYLKDKTLLPEPPLFEQHAIIKDHVEAMLHHYGEDTGVKIARKHVGWYSKGLNNSADFRVNINQANSAQAMKALIDDYYVSLLNS